MINMKCGNCGIEYSLTMENVVQNLSSNKCPNCGKEMPRSLSGALGDFCRALTSENENWEINVLEFQTKRGVLTVEGSLTLR